MKVRVGVGARGRRTPRCSGPRARVARPPAADRERSPHQPRCPSIGRIAETVILRIILPSLIFAVLLTPLSIHAQQAGKVARVGLLFPSTPAPWVEPLRVFRQRLLELGWAEG